MQVDRRSAVFHSIMGSPVTEKKSRCCALFKKIFHKFPDRFKNPGGLSHDLRDVLRATINPDFFQNEMKPAFPVVCLAWSDRSIHPRAIGAWMGGNDFVCSFSARLITEDSDYEFVFKLLTKNLPQNCFFRPCESINLRVEADPDWDLSIENHVWVEKGRCK